MDALDVSRSVDLPDSAATDNDGADADAEGVDIIIIVDVFDVLRPEADEAETAATADDAEAEADDNDEDNNAVDDDAESRGPRGITSSVSASTR